MTELARRANGVDTCSDQVTRKRVPEIVEPELGQVIAVKARRFCCSVETALRNVIPVKRCTGGGGEDVGVRAWQPARSLGGAEVITEMRLELTGECDISPAGLRLEIDAARWTCLRATTQLGSHADHALAEVDVSPGESEDLLDPHSAEHREREQRPITRRAALEEPPHFASRESPRLALSSPPGKFVPMQSQHRVLGQVSARCCWKDQRRLASLTRQPLLAEPGAIQLPRFAFRWLARKPLDTEFVTIETCRLKPGWGWELPGICGNIRGGS